MAQDTIRIRMYAVGFGDCFLLGFPDPKGGRERLMLIDCGDPPASSATRRVAEEVPYAVGEKVTLTEHPMVAGHCSPEQVSALRLYAAAPEPDNVIEDTSKEAVPSLITLIDWLADWPVTVLGKLTELGVNAAWA